MRIVLFLSFIVFGALCAAPAFAGAPLQNSGCDATFWTVLGNRAWMEAEHDNEAAQTFIEFTAGPIHTRPSSILDLSDYECDLQNLGSQENGDPLFSRNLGNGVLFKNQSFTPIDIFEPVIAGPAHTYTSTDGFHPSIGWKALVTEAPQPGTALINLIRVGLKKYFYPTFYFPNPLPPPPATVCGSMSGVWQAAKCTDFDDGSFWTFSGMVHCDPRGCIFPPCVPTGRNTASDPWKANYMGSIGPWPPPTPPPTYLYIDPASDFLSLLNPSNCGTPGPIPPPPQPLPTGVTVFHVDATGPTPTTIKYNDAFCPSAGCYYDPTSNTCKN